jgi:hypothetical protein
MRASSRRSRRLLWLSFLSLACLSALAGEQPARAKAPATSATQAALPRPSEALYGADEALRDALSGPLQHVGTGRWPGISRMYTCAFRNERVLVVNVYCGTTDVRAFRVDILSPKRGRVRIYAEASGPILSRARHQYFTFMAESEPPAGPEAHMRPLALTMSFDALRAYEKQRYGAYLPACYGGQEHARARGACLGKLAARNAEWASQNRPFLERASDDWYRVMRGMRGLASRHGKDPAKSSRTRRGSRMQALQGMQ